MNIGVTELIVILIVALLVIGPKRLPDVAQALGKGLAEFKRAMDNVKEELKVDEVRQDIYDMKDSLLFKKGYEDGEKKEASSPDKEHRGENPSQTAQSEDHKTPVEKA